MWDGSPAKPSHCARYLQLQVRLRVGSHGSIELRLPRWRMWDGMGEPAGPAYAVTMDSRTESSALAVAAWIQQMTGIQEQRRSAEQTSMIRQ